MKSIPLRNYIFINFVDYGIDNIMLMKERNNKKKNNVWACNYYRVLSYFFSSWKRKQLSSQYTEPVLRHTCIMHEREEKKKVNKNYVLYITFRFNISLFVIYYFFFTFATALSAVCCRLFIFIKQWVSLFFLSFCFF